MVFGYGSGEETKQSWPDIGLNFDSSIRAAKSTHATLYVLDGQTGDELYSSGEQITSFNHFSGLTVVNGRVYIGTLRRHAVLLRSRRRAAHSVERVNRSTKSSLILLCVSQRGAYRRTPSNWLDV